MSGLFASRGSTSDPWFRIGRLEVSTVMLTVLLMALSCLAWVAAPSLPNLLGYSPEYMVAGQVWRVFTWPFANDLSLWTLLSLFFFWYFGTELEQQLGRVRMAWLLVGVWASITVASTVVGLITRSGVGVAGFGLIEFAVLLLWIAEWPDRRFFFNIPAWVIGLVLLGLQVFGLIAARAGESLISLLLSLVLVAIVARNVGLLGAYSWIPGGRTAARPSSRAPRPSRGAAARQSRQQQRTMSDREALDALLDQINEKGLNSLTEAQRKELLRLRERLRGS